MEVHTRLSTIVKWPIKQFSVVAPKNGPPKKFKGEDFKLGNGVTMYLYFSSVTTIRDANKDYCSLHLIARDLKGNTPISLSFRMWIENNDGDAIGGKIEGIADEVTPTAQILGWAELVENQKLYDSEIAKEDVIVICCEIQVLPPAIAQVVPEGLPQIDEAQKQALEAGKKEWKFFEQGFTGDCIIQVGEQEFPVNKSKLMAASTVFNAMFHSETRDAPIGKINMQFSVAAIKALIKYVHVYQLENLAEGMLELYSLAEKYGLDDLKEKCSKILTDGLTPENVVGRLILAFQNNDEDLKQIVIAYLSSLPPEKTLRDMMKSDEWLDFASTNMKLMSQVLAALSEKLN